MNWKFWQKKQTTDDILRDFFVNQVKSGVSVNHKTALQAAAAFGCARVIAEDIAKVPFKIMQSMENGTRNPAKDHDLYDLLHSQPNDRQTSFEFFEQIGFHLVFAGNAYVFKNRVRGRIVELLPYEPGSVLVKQNDDMSLVYEITLASGKKIDIPARDMWHIRGPSWDGVEGLDGVKLARESIGISIATEEHNARLFSNGARVGGILTTDKDLKSDQVKELRESWEKVQGGNSNAHKTAVVWGGLKYIQAALTSLDAQLNETRRFQIEEVCRFFRVMPIMLAHYDKASTYASSVEMFSAHIRNTMTAWYIRIEKSIDVFLLTKEERKDGFYSKFNVNGLLRGSAKDRALFYTAMYNIGAINPNEIRELEDMNPYEGGEKYRVPLNMADPTDETPDTEDENPNPDKVE